MLITRVMFGVIAAILFCFHGSVVASNIASWSELSEAISSANATGSGKIRISSGAALFATDSLPTITGNLVILGNGATVRSAPGSSPDYLFLISNDGDLQVKDLWFNRIDVLRGLVINEGAVDFQNVSISEIPLSRETMIGQPRPPVHPANVLSNSGTMDLENVTITESDVFGFGSAVILNNNGALEIRNSTIAANRSFLVGRVSLEITGLNPSALDSGGGEARLTLANTLLDNADGNCDTAFQGVFEDLGGNLDTDNSCGLDDSVNLVGTASGLGEFGQNGGLVPTFSLVPTSPAIDAGRNEVCSALDARFATRPSNGSRGGQRRCDVGAYEYAGGFGNSDLRFNGMNGLWFNAETDGHYVHVMRVTAERVYVNWTTFDTDGNQLWIFGVAETQENGVLFADAYVNEGGVLTPGGAPLGHVVNLWGQIELSFSDCSVGAFQYRPFDTSLSPGSFELNRLAFIEASGCVDLGEQP